VIQTKVRNPAGMNTKFHLAITADGNLIERFLTTGNVCDITVANELTKNVVGCDVLEDMGYDSNEHRQCLRSNNNTPVIFGRKNRKIPIIYDKSLYKLRRQIEIFFGKLKENKRLAMRYDKSDQSFFSFIALAAVKIFLGLKIS
jgi:transposase